MAFALGVTRGELSGTRLRLAGTGAVPNASITVDGAVLGQADGAGNFRIERDPFPKPADCIVDVNDGSASIVPVRLTGCTIDQPAGGTGTISIVRGGTGHGRITSQPAGIDCTLLEGSTVGPCNAFFAAGTLAKLDARPLADSKFLGWLTPGSCKDAPNVLVAADVIHSCQPAFRLK